MTNKNKKSVDYLRLDEETVQGRAEATLGRRLNQKELIRFGHVLWFDSKIHDELMSVMGAAIVAAVDDTVS